MKDHVMKVYKKCGITPLECINSLKREDSKLRLLPMTYAGRLDPLAEGVLLILVGDECQNKEAYLNLSKEYEVEILFGFATDTYDVMGKITKYNTLSFRQFSNSEISDGDGLDYDNFILKIRKIIPEFIGKIKQSYPPYSSRPVKGKPLFEWARAGKLNEIEIPTHDVVVEDIEIIDTSFIQGSKLFEKIKEMISMVKGDFRQREILSIWSNELANKKQEKYMILKLRIVCGSGVYVRGIANEIGKELCFPSLALKIVRTKVGEYKV